MRAAVFALLALIAVVPPAIAFGQVALPMTRAEDGEIRIDGSTREWRGIRFLEVGSGPDASMRFALAFDDTGLYIGAEVRDERFVRTASPGTEEDAVILTLAMPASQSGVYSATEVWLWAGDPGRSAASVGIGEIGGRPRPGARPGVQIVEGPARGGYTLEAFVPWSAVPGGTRWQEALGTIRLRDVDQAAHPQIEEEPALAPVDRAHLESLPALRADVGATATFDQFLASQGMPGARPASDLRGDVGGDARAERVSIVDRFVVVTGEGWQEGRGYSFLQLPVQSAGDVREPRLIDLTGDGKGELTVTLRERDERGARDVFEVYTFTGLEVRPIFAIETRKETSAGSVECRLLVRPGRRGAAATIEVRAGRARGLDSSTLREAPASDAEPILLPWGPFRARVYRWDGSVFARIEESPNPDYVDPTAARETAARETGAHETGARESATRETRARESAARETGARESAARESAARETATVAGIDALLAAFREQRGIHARSRPTFRILANVAASAEPETIHVYGRDLVVVGPAFRNGTGWFHFEIPAREPDDVIEVRTAEVTGDARQEILMRVRQRLGAVTREVLLVFQFTPAGFPCLLQRELVRAEGESRIENEIVAGEGRLEIRPGAARGWGAESYRYPDTAGADGVEPPLLPWRDAAITLRYSGGRLTQ